VPFKYLILMPDIQEAKCYEFTVQIGAPIGGGPKKISRFMQILPPPLDLFLYTPLTNSEQSSLQSHPSLPLYLK